MEWCILLLSPALTFGWFIPSQGKAVTVTKPNSQSGAVRWYIAIASLGMQVCVLQTYLIKTQNESHREYAVGNRQNALSVFHSYDSLNYDIVTYGKCHIIWISYTEMQQSLATPQHSFSNILVTKADWKDQNWMAPSWVPVYYLPPPPLHRCLAPTSPARKWNVAEFSLEQVLMNLWRTELSLLNLIASLMQVDALFRSFFSGIVFPHPFCPLNGHLTWGTYKWGPLAFVFH